MLIRRWVRIPISTHRLILVYLRPALSRVVCALRASASVLVEATALEEFAGGEDEEQRAGSLHERYGMEGR